LQIFTRYITNISHAAKGEKLMNPISGDLEPPDERLMRETEESFRIETDGPTFRDGVISRIAAWAIDNPGAPIHYTELYPDLFEAMRMSYHEKQRTTVQSHRAALERFFADGAESLPVKERDRVHEIMGNMMERYGYCELSAEEAVLYLLQSRYSG
jgi:predicted Ser/Thr protein kinase